MLELGPRIAKAVPSKTSAPICVPRAFRPRHIGGKTEGQR